MTDADPPDASEYPGRWTVALIAASVVATAAAWLAAFHFP